MIALGTRIEQVFARKVHPVIVADDLHAAFCRLIPLSVRITCLWSRCASSDFRDMVQAVRLFDVMRQLREARILVVSDHKQPQGDGDRIQPLETMIVRLGSDRLNEYYDATDEQVAR